MIKKGIILAGGFGKRMSPLTKAVNKQLLPVYDKPLIFYPWSILMLAGIRDILVIVNKGMVSQFEKILPKKNNFGVKITYAEQSYPKGLPDAFKIGEKFIGKSKVSLILGDNFFYGQALTPILKKCVKLKNGATVFLHKVRNPSAYAVAKVNRRNKIIKIVEKPKKPFSKDVVTGLYFFDNKVVKYCKNLKPSKRKELEIVDLLNKYRKKNKLNAEFLGRGGAWLDTGSIEDFYKTSDFVSNLENRQGFKIACLEEIAYNYKWINNNNIRKAIKFYGNCNYSNYLKNFLSKKK